MKKFSLRSCLDSFMTLLVFSNFCSWELSSDTISSFLSCIPPPALTSCLQTFLCLRPCFSLSCSPLLSVENPLYLASILQKKIKKIKRYSHTYFIYVQYKVHEQPHCPFSNGTNERCRRISKEMHECKFTESHCCCAGSCH